MHISGDNKIIDYLKITYEGFSFWSLILQINSKAKQIKSRVNNLNTSLKCGVWPRKIWFFINFRVLSALFSWIFIICLHHDCINYCWYPKGRDILAIQRGNRRNLSCYRRQGLQSESALADLRRGRNNFYISHLFSFAGNDSFVLEKISEHSLLQ